MLLRKGMYLKEYIDSWEGFDETLPDKEAFYSNINMEGVTSVDGRNVKEYIKKLNLKTRVIIMTCMLKVIQYCLPMYLKTLETSALKYLDLIPLIFCLHQD